MSALYCSVIPATESQIPRAFFTTTRAAALRAARWKEIPTNNARREIAESHPMQSNNFNSSAATARSASKCNSININSARPHFSAGNHNSRRRSRHVYSQMDTIINRRGRQFFGRTARFRRSEGQHSGVITDSKRGVRANYVCEDNALAKRMYDEVADKFWVCLSASDAVCLISTVMQKFNLLVGVQQICLLIFKFPI